jgi:hypothetical protein
MKNAKMWAIVVAVAVAGIASISIARADEVQAKSLLKAMSDYLGAQKTISFDYDSNLEIVSSQQQKVGLASSGTLTLERPDKLRATRTGGFANVEMVFDGKTLSLLGKNANLYAQVEAPGTIDHLVDELRDKYHRPVPAADLLMSDPYKELMPPVTDVKDLGSGVIRGIECDHLAFRTKEVDWQIWIAQGARPYPCRYVITSKKVTGGPQYTLDIRAWKADGEVASDAFKLEIPPGAQKLTPGQIPDLDDVPAFSRRKEQSDYVQAHRCCVAGCNHLVLLPGTRRPIRDSGLAELRLHRRGRRRPPPDADECRRRRATDLASLCGRGLLLGERCVPTDEFQPRKFLRNLPRPDFLGDLLNLRLP